MKLYQVALLVAGAGIAGGLALKMTQLPPIALPPPPEPAVSAVPPVAPLSQKPSPIPRAESVNAPTAVRTTAPQPIYDEPPKPVVHRTQPAAPPAPVNSATNIKPKQWIPGRYDSSGGPATAPKAAAKSASAPLVPASTDKAAVTPVVPAIENPPAAPAPHPAAPHQATLLPGMSIPIRLGETLSSNHSQTGGTFAGSLAEPLVADGFVIAERGARVWGRVIDSERAGRFTGTSRLQIGLTGVLTSDGQQVTITTEPWLRLGDSIPAETVVRFRLTSKVTITERQLDAARQRP